MSDPRYCREQALKCANAAIRADERRERKALTKAARVWLQMALDLETRLEASNSKASEFGFKRTRRSRATALEAASDG